MSRSRPFHGAASDSGFTLTELMMVVALLGVVLGMVYANMDIFLKISGATESKSATVSTTRTAMERVTRQIRAANPIDVLPDPSAYANEIAFSVYCSSPGVQGCGSDHLRQVAYRLTANAIVETIGATSVTILGPEGPAAVPVAERRGAVVNGAEQPVFRYFDRDSQPLSPATDPPTTFRDCTKSVEIHLVVVARDRGPERVDLTTRVDLRNFNEVAGC